MSVRDISSVFGRYFIVGFFLPAFFWLTYLKLLAGPGLVPNGVQANTAGSFAAVGIAALVLGFFLQGIRIPLIRLLSGYYVMQWGPSRWAPTRHRLLAWVRQKIWVALRWKALREFRKLTVAAGSRGPQRPGEDEESYARRRLDEYWLGQRFPDRESKVLPTTFGNRIRAWEDYARTRWSLETTLIRPYTEAMLGPQETDLRTNALTDVAFAVNATLLAWVITFTLGVDRALERPSSLWFLLACLAPVAAAIVSYEIAIVAATAWGDTVRVGIDLHRLDLYDKLGVRRPRDLAEEATIGIAINRMMLYGERLPDEIRVGDSTGTTGDPGQASLFSLPLDRSDADGSLELKMRFRKEAD